MSETGLTSEQKVDHLMDMAREYRRDEQGTVESVPSGILGWEDPPAKGKTRYERTATALMASPGRWAVVEEKRDGKSTNSSQIRKALNELLGEGQVAVHEHSLGAGVKRVYARYTPAAG